MTNGQNETGGVFLGYIVNRAWYIVESIDPGMDTVNQVAFFQWDTEYVNHQAERLSKIYHKPLTVLGFWHRHPGSMDYFSGQDETTIRTNLRELRAGLLSMLVNIDPKLRMTYYYCYGNDIMKIRYDVGNKYFPAELMKYADAAELSRRAQENGKYLDIHYEQVINLDAVATRKKASSDNIRPLDEKKTATTTPSTTASGNRENFKQPNTYLDRIPDATIKRIAEIVAGIEGDTNSRIELLSKKVSLLEEAIKLLIEKNDLVLSRISSAETVESQGTLTTADVEKIVKITTETIAEMTSEYRNTSVPDTDIEATKSDTEITTGDSETETEILIVENGMVENCEEGTEESDKSNPSDSVVEPTVNEE